MKKNILLIMTDQQRIDIAGILDKQLSRFPNIAKLNSCVSFTNCQTTNPICTPARTSLITGRYSRQIGMVTMSGDLDFQIPTFMQALQRSGYETYGIGKLHFLQTWKWGTKRGEGLDFIANEQNMKKFGFNFVWETAGKQQLVQNYCHYCDYLSKLGLLDQYRDFVEQSGGGNGDLASHNYDKSLPFPLSTEHYVDIVTGRVAKQKLEQHDKTKPFYMLTSFCGPHKPYDPPAEYMNQFEIERKDDFVLQDGEMLADQEKEIIYRQRRSARAMLKVIDDQIGLLLDVLRQRDMLNDTMVVFTSDHGDMLGDHGLIQKGVPWRQSSNVPLAIMLDGRQQNPIVDSCVELTDVAATILDYAGLDLEDALARSWPAYNDRLPCRSLMPIIRGEALEVREYSFCESDFTEERVNEYNRYSKDEYQRVRGKGRDTAWQMICDKRYKYIKYLGYDEPGKYHEELYDLAVDQDELNDIANSEKTDEVMRLCRDRLMYVLDKYQPAQTTWTRFEENQ